MPTINWKIVSGILACALAYDTVVGQVNHRRHRRLLKRLDGSVATQHYLASLLDQQGYSLTDFDKTALLTINDM